MRKANPIALAALALLLLAQWIPSARAEETSTFPYQEPRPSSAKSGELGLGLKWGDLTGLTAKYWDSETRAWDFTLAFDNGATAFGVDYLWHFRSAFSGFAHADSLVPFAGFGVIGASGPESRYFNRRTSDFELAARIPGGLEFLPRSVSLGIFVEAALGFGFTPTNYSFVTADLGARYYF